jgi:hypothetical protein
VAIALGGNSIVPAAARLLPAWLNDSDWRKRHGALICLAQIAEGCAKQMSGQLPALTDMCMKGLTDVNAKVRWRAAILAAPCAARLRYSVLISARGSGWQWSAGAAHPRRHPQAPFRSQASRLALGLLGADGTAQPALTLGERLPACLRPQVRWAACQALGQMCTDLGPEIQETQHAKIVPGLMTLMDDFNNSRCVGCVGVGGGCMEGAGLGLQRCLLAACAAAAAHLDSGALPRRPAVCFHRASSAAPGARLPLLCRVQAHASAAVVNFSENCEKELLQPYLDTLIHKLLLLLQHGKRLVQEGALTAMASVADCAQVGRRAAAWPAGAAGRRSSGPAASQPACAAPGLSLVPAPGSTAAAPALPGLPLLQQNSQLLSCLPGHVCQVLRHRDAAAAQHPGARHRQEPTPAARQDHRVHLAGACSRPAAQPQQIWWLVPPRLPHGPQQQQRALVQQRPPTEARRPAESARQLEARPLCWPAAATPDAPLPRCAAVCRWAWRWARSASGRTPPS